ncbi:pentatricopeptide repeat-containing protein 1, mitochondrial-like [Schistocerca gregaria]|uniref:pentatricopeptide repeat-containing protein 1, mitochondrial-like n=1 Tax=Schistocerca gregaria TaxID=7010 RepID=UPI00211EB190|nr:pentatricopeptide repeat-containing protein 1, mitochondrial-like [Schistocerca gregaria]XP_049849527.1 pentatricopeptide repeat-containing protein 1, mitochondrial-like [Schistocerca gregaria]XP_049849528.1 pentatricopeptide repeat-containing protein 1, mitochondrial-like [Schistocerca gregaria]
MFLKPLAQSFSLRTFSRRFLAASSSPKKTQGSLPKAKQRSKTLVNISEEQKLAELKRRRIEKNENLRELLDALERLDTSAVWEIHSKPLRIDEPTYTKMVALMAKAGYVKKTFSLYQKLKKRALKPSLDTFYWLLISLVNAASDGDYVSRVFYVVEQLEKYGYLLTLRLSNLMLLVCARAKDRASCSSVLSIMLKHRVRPDVSSLTTLIHCSKGEGLDNINLMWKSVLKFFDPDIRAWNTYLTLLREENYTEEVFLIFEHLLAYSAVRVKTSRLAKWEEKNRVLAAGSKREGVIEVLDGRNSIKGDKSPREALKLATASSEDNAEVVGFSGDDDGYMNKNGTRNEESVCIEYVAQDSEGIDCQNNHNKNRIGASVASQVDVSTHLAPLYTLTPPLFQTMNWCSILICSRWNRSRYQTSIRFR